MVKRKKIKTSDWILKNDLLGSKMRKKKEIRSFKIRTCPKCGSDEVGVILGNEEGKGLGEWGCKKCKWQGKNVNEEQLSEEEFMKYLDNKNIPVS